MRTNVNLCGGTTGGGYDGGRNYLEQLQFTAAVSLTIRQITRVDSFDR